MTVSIQTFAVGDTNYITKHNDNGASIKAAVEAAEDTIVTLASDAAVTATDIAALEAADVLMQADIAELQGEGGAPGDGAQIYDVGGTYNGALGTSAVLLRYPMPRAAKLPAGLIGSAGVAATAATATAVIDIQKNGTSVGSMTFAAAAGTANFAMTSETAFAAGDVLTVVAPGTADATLADIGFSLAGTRDGGYLEDIAGGSGEWYLHQVYNVSGAVDGIFFDMPTGAKSVKFVGVGMKTADTTTNNQPFRIRFSVDNGTTYAGVDKYSWKAKTEKFDITTSTFSNGESTTYHKILEWYKQHTSKSFNFECVVDNPNGSEHKFINSRAFGYQDIDSTEQFTTGTFGAFEETSAITNVEFYMFAGSLIDMNAGSIYMYVRKDTV